jgi:hypothetical protein
MQITFKAYISVYNPTSALEDIPADAVAAARPPPPIRQQLANGARPREKRAPEWVKAAVGGAPSGGPAARVGLGQAREGGGPADRARGDEHGSRVGSRARHHVLYRVAVLDNRVVRTCRRAGRERAPEVGEVQSLRMSCRRSGGPRPRESPGPGCISADMSREPRRECAALAESAWALFGERSDMPCTWPKWSSRPETGLARVASV